MVKIVGFFPILRYILLAYKLLLEKSELLFRSG